MDVFRAEGQRANGQTDFLLDFARAVRDDFRARPADVDKQARFLAEVMCRPDEVVRRLFVARNHADGQAREPLNLTDGRLTVLCIAQRRRRKGHDVRDVERQQKRLELLQNFHGLVDALLLHDTFLQIGRESDCMFFFHQHLDMRALNAVNRHADRVRADINHSI